MVLNNYNKYDIHGQGGTHFLSGDMDEIRHSINSDPILKTKVDAIVIPTEKYEKLVYNSNIDIPEDDWPYLYLQTRRLPTLHIVMIIIMIVLMLLAVRYLFPGKKIGSSHFLFLGAGFMVVEVHSISKTALLFGSTWIVNAVIIGAILVMILCANLITLRYKIDKLSWCYAGLFITLSLSYLVPVQKLIIGGYLVRGILAGGFYSLPLFFAGIIFASGIRRVKGIDGAFAANMMGAAIGGMIENFSYIFGLKAVVLVAILFYIASAVSMKRMQVLDEV